MKKITIKIEETTPEQRATMGQISGREIGKYRASVSILEKEIRLYSFEDAARLTPEEKESTIYAQTQMLGLHDSIKFAILSIADGRIS